MLWTAEAVEDLKKLALEGKSAAGIAAALGVGSRNAVIGKASRIGIKLNGGGRAAASSKTGGASGAMGDDRQPSAGRRQARLGRRPCARSPGRARAGQGCVDLWRSRGRGDAAVAVRGDSRIRLPVAARRSEKRGLRLLRAHAGGRPVLLRRPLPDGLPVPTGEAKRERAAGISRHREFVAGGLRAGSCPLEDADQTGRVRARFAPRRRRPDEERP